MKSWRRAPWPGALCFNDDISRKGEWEAPAPCGRGFFLEGVRFNMDIEVKFDGKEIIVTKPGTDFMTAYRKRPDSPTLLLTRSWVNPHITSPEISEFRAKAFQAAVSKARELGWIV